MVILPADVTDEERHCVSLALVAINSVQSPPVLDASVQNLLQAVQDPYVDMHGLVDQIEQQPAMAARLIGLANSALYSPKQPISSVTDAVIRILGMDLTRGIVLGFLLSNVFTTDACGAFDDRRYWRDALTLARLSREYAVLANEDDDAITLAYLAGLLHRLGLMVGASADPSGWHTVLADASEEPLAQRLVHAHGFHHRHASQAIASLWTLPADVRDNLVESPPANSPGRITWIAKDMLDVTETDVTELIEQTSQQHAQIFSCTSENIAAALAKAKSESKLSLTSNAR